MVIFVMSRMRGCFRTHAPSLPPSPFWNFAPCRTPRLAPLLLSTTCKHARTHESYLTPLFSGASGHFSVGPPGVPSSSLASPPFDPTPPRHLYSPIFLRSEVPCT